jgi:hypothetical protein
VLLFVLLRAVREAGAGVALVSRTIGDEVELDHDRAELPDLMHDLRVRRGAPRSLEESLERSG